MRILGDRPLFCHAIANARASELITSVVIDSDSDEILDVGAHHGAVPLRRPADLATNRTTGDELAYWQANNYPESQIVVQVVPTSPFVRPSSLDGAIQLLLNLEVDSVAGVFAEALYVWRDGGPAYLRADGSIPNSGEMQKLVYETTGLYVNRTRAVLASRRRLCLDSCAPYYLSRIEAIDIDTEDDFELAATVWLGLRGNSATGGSINPRPE
jgi:CMP-N-acetylneuraminic acid synthetase